MADDSGRLTSIIVLLFKEKYALYMRLVFHLKIPDHYRTQRNTFIDKKKVQIWKTNTVKCVRTLSVTLKRNIPVYAGFTSFLPHATKD